jgi:V/A-type H+/Na+-transporting ATPase subunit D
MAEKIKLNKNTLREQKQMLALYQEFLPTLELRKQQLQTELRGLDRRVDERRTERDALYASAAPWAPMLERALPWIRPLVALEEVVVKPGNVAGVKVPVFERVEFTPASYSLMATPPFYDAAIDYVQQTISAREELKVLERQREMLRKELVKTTQRINLYEKLLIPETKENIRRIKVYLGDQQTAAVCRAKIAKGKLVAKAAASAAAEALRAGGD